MGSLHQTFSEALPQVTPQDIVKEVAEYGRDAALWTGGVSLFFVAVQEGSIERAAFCGSLIGVWSYFHRKMNQYDERRAAKVEVAVSPSVAP